MSILEKYTKTRKGDITVCGYSITDRDILSSEEIFGMLYFADVFEFENELHSEIEKIIKTKNLIAEWTYPVLDPALVAEAKRRKCF